MKNLATWGERFWAWLIDFVIIVLVFGALIPFINAGISVIFLAYWALMDYYKGQSIGKMVMNLKIVNKKGKQITPVQALIESFGKSFILVIDVIIGLIFFRAGEQRLFEKLSDTYVIRTKKRK